MSDQPLREAAARAIFAIDQDAPVDDPNFAIVDADHHYSLMAQAVLGVVLEHFAAKPFGVELMEDSLERHVAMRVAEARDDAFNEGATLGQVEGARVVLEQVTTTIEAHREAVARAIYAAHVPSGFRPWEDAHPEDTYAVWVMADAAIEAGLAAVRGLGDTTKEAS